MNMTDTMTTTTERATECSICYISRDSAEFLSCIQCPYETCLMCFSKLSQSKCPFCRTSYDINTTRIDEMKEIPSSTRYSSPYGCTSFHLPNIRVFVDRVFVDWDRVKEYLAQRTEMFERKHPEGMPRLDCQYITSFSQLLDEKPDDLFNKMRSLREDYEKSRQSVIDEWTYDYPQWRFVTNIGKLRYRLLWWPVEKRYGIRFILRDRFCVNTDCQVCDLVRLVVRKFEDLCDWLNSRRTIVSTDAAEIPIDCTIKRGDEIMNELRQLRFSSLELE
jgi:hypothetical protein